MDSLQIFHKNMSKSAQIFTKIMHCSGTPLVRPPLLHKKVAFQEGWPLSRGRNQYINVYIYIVKWPF